MNPLTNVRNIQKLNETELKLGTVGKKSWHDQYKDSAWVFIGGLPYDLTEGDILAVFSQYGEIVNINLIRDKQSGKSKGYGFLCFEDQRSTVLSVDNLNSIKILGRTIRVDHVEAYKKPKEHENDDDITKQIRKEGCAPTIQKQPVQEPLAETVKVKKEKDKSKKKKKDKKMKKKKEKKSSSEDEPESPVKRNHSNSTQLSTEHVVIKNEKHDSGYDKALSKRDHASGEINTDVRPHSDRKYYKQEVTQGRRENDRDRKRQTDRDTEFEHKKQKTSSFSKVEDRGGDGFDKYDRDVEKHRHEKRGGYNDDELDRRRGHHDRRDRR